MKIKSQYKSLLTKYKQIQTDIVLDCLIAFDFKHTYTITAI